MSKSRNTRKSLKKKLDQVFSLWIRNRDKVCQIHQPHDAPYSILQCGHLFSRVAESTRWDELNCCAVCAGCNLRHEYSPDVHTRWFIRKYGLEKYEKLAQKYHTIKKHSLEELKELIKKYE